jgi:hypothetical protein
MLFLKPFGFLNVFHRKLAKTVELGIVRDRINGRQQIPGARPCAVTSHANHERLLIFSIQIATTVIGRMVHDQGRSKLIETSPHQYLGFLTKWDLDRSLGRLAFADVALEPASMTGSLARLSRFPGLERLQPFQIFQSINREAV